MKLFTERQRTQLLANGRRNAGRENTQDFRPVVKLFAPWGAGTWLLSEIDPDDHDIAFGLCDLGMGVPELGKVSLREIAALCGPAYRRIERDLYFVATKSLSAYAEDAARQGRIVA